MRGARTNTTIFLHTPLHDENDMRIEIAHLIFTLYFPINVDMRGARSQTQPLFRTPSQAAKIACADQAAHAICLANHLQLRTVSEPPRGAHQPFRDMSHPEGQSHGSFSCTAVNSVSHSCRRTLLLTASS